MIKRIPVSHNALLLIAGNPETRVGRHFPTAPTARREQPPKGNGIVEKMRRTLRRFGNDNDRLRQ